MCVSIFVCLHMLLLIWAWLCVREYMHLHMLCTTSNDCIHCVLHGAWYQPCKVLCIHLLCILICRTLLYYRIQERKCALHSPVLWCRGHWTTWRMPSFWWRSTEQSVAGEQVYGGGHTVFDSATVKVAALLCSYYHIIFVFLFLMFWNDYSQTNFYRIVLDKILVLFSLSIWIFIYSI